MTKKNQSILSVAPVHMQQPYEYSYSFDSLLWHQRMLHYMGSGQLLLDYEFQRRRGVPLKSNSMGQVQEAVRSIEDFVGRIAKDSFYTAMSGYWRTLQQRDNGRSMQDVYEAAMMRIALDHTFPGHPDLLEMRKWPLWKLTVYIPCIDNTNVVTFNEPTKEDAFNRIVQAYLESEGCTSGKQWLISDVSSVDNDLINSYTLICEFSQFADPLIGDAFAIPVHVPDDAWTQDSQLDFIETPTVHSSNSYRTYTPDPYIIYSRQGSKGTTK